MGPACVEVIAGLLAVNALYRLRAAQGVLSLADRHSPERTEDAWAKALVAGDPYRTIKGILATDWDRRSPLRRPAPRRPPSRARCGGCRHHLPRSTGRALAARVELWVRSLDGFIQDRPEGRLFELLESGRMLRLPT